MEASYHSPDVVARIKAVRQQRGQTQQDVADHLGISRSYYAAIENGTKTIGLKNAARFAETYGISSDWLIWGRGESPLDSERNNRGNTGGNTYIQPELISQLEELAARYGSLKSIKDLIDAKDEAIAALKSENQVLRELIFLLKKQLPEEP
ncbi:MAG: hypothetical protein OHK0039_46540 [Bacteroidia bacterium]